RTGLGTQHREIINQGSGVAASLITMSASVVSIKILQVVNHDGPRIRGLDIITLRNVIPLIIMAIAGRPRETLISLCQLWVDRTGNGSSHLYLATIFLLLILPAD
ncbi:hypothetical protein CY34DRAFT_811575, partial [Suillus luteus UH-Slu-Lm8-n1]